MDPKRPSAISMSASANPSASASSLAGASETGTRARDTRNDPPSGIAISAIGSVLPADCTFVPVPQEQVGKEAGRGEAADSGQRQEHERREEARDVQPMLRLDQPEGEA